MPILIVFKDGKACPHFCCDHCNRPVMPKEHAGSILTWTDSLDEKAAIYAGVLCAGCSTDIHQSASTMELETAWFFLKNNSGFNYKRAEKNARLTGEM